MSSLSFSPSSPLPGRVGVYLLLEVGGLEASLQGGALADAAVEPDGAGGAIRVGDEPDGARRVPSKGGPRSFSMMGFSSSRKRSWSKSNTMVNSPPGAKQEPAPDVGHGSGRAPGEGALLEVVRHEAQLALPFAGLVAAAQRQLGPESSRSAFGESSRRSWKRRRKAPSKPVRRVKKRSFSGRSGRCPSPSRSAARRCGSAGSRGRGRGPAGARRDRRVG